MTSTKKTLIVVSMLIMLPITIYVPGSNLTIEKHSIQFPNDSENIGWGLLQNPYAIDYQISDSSGEIHSPFGSVDPLSGDLPLGPWIRAGLENPYDSRLHIVQSQSSDLQSLKLALGSLGLEIIDQIPDDSVVISLQENSNMTSKISRLPEVRWIGPMPSMWKISPVLISMIPGKSSEIDLDITPSSLNSFDENEQLFTFISQLGGINQELVHCDSHICQIKSADFTAIPKLASNHLVMKIDPGPILSIMNSNASFISGIDHSRLSSETNLTGLGEVIGISDTGLDVDHGDFDGRLRSPIYNLFGPDNSGADTNSGHGTHVTATLLGDGSGDQNATGMAPEATFHFYQLEVDSSGLLARWGSLYEMFEHSYLNDASIHTNSWGSSTLLGDYTSDSRSADWFSNDHPEFLIIFSAGDMSVSGISSPGTAKNVLTVGASTTSSFNSEPMGFVSNDSSIGPTSDGRIKPDLVAPGVMICSARAEEAALASGGPCSDSVHDDGTTPRYMTMSGTSMATPVAAGAAAMARQFLREEIDIENPRSDLIRALLVNGAEDIGDQDVPNAREGWGQLNLSNSLFPQNAGNALPVFFDQERVLLPGHSFVYTFDVSSQSGIEATLAWNDREGSSSSDQNSSRLVNNLDLIFTSPDGSVFYGNNFANGISQPGGSTDNQNNLERIRIPDSQIGTWTVQVGHSGGFSQQYSLVLTADAEEILESDLAVVQNSISSSETSPLKGDTISLQLSWINQAAEATGDYSILLEDISVSDSEIGTYRMPSLPGGAIETFSIYHSFSSTGPHTIRLTLDNEFEVDELNDEQSGSNNNIFELLFDVTEIGVRLTPLMDDGSYPSNFQESQQAKNRVIDPSTVSWANFELELLNEGTSEITVELSVTAVQEVGDSGILDNPLDEWSRTLNESSPWVLQPFGEEGDRVVVSLNLTDEDADLESRFALPGMFVSDLTLFDKLAPTISHSARLSVDVERVEGLFTVPAGTEDLGAKPSNFAQFTLSVKNIGNGPTEYMISCETEDRWVVHVGNSQSSVATIGPLSRLQFVPVPIRVKIPPASSGLAAGSTNLVTCVTTSVNDQSLQTIETAIVQVMESKDFVTKLSEIDGLDLGPVAISESRAVLNGESVSTLLLITNNGNVPLNFEVQALSSINTWPIQTFLSEDTPPLGEVKEIETSVLPGETTSITIRTLVPLAAEKGERNTISIMTSLDEITVTNGTVLEVREITTLDVEADSGFSIALGSSGNSNIYLHNSGNVPLAIDLTLGSIPDGWAGGFLTGKSFTMEMNRDSMITIGLELPSGVSAGTLSEKVPVIIESTSPSLSKEVFTVELEVTVLPSVWIKMEPTTYSLQGISEGEGAELTLRVMNFGNFQSSIAIESSSLRGWDVDIEPNFIQDLGAGDSEMLSVTIRPTGSSEDGLKELIFFANSTDSNPGVISTESSISIDVSKSRSSNQGGISGLFEFLGLPAWTLALLFIFALVTLVFLGVRARSEYIPVRSEDELIPRGSALHAGSREERMAAALDTSTAGDVVTGDVSQSEIQEMLQSTIPTLPTHQVPEGAAPLPLSGLPDGWTMDQWVAYGHMWWEQNGP